MIMLSGKSDKRVSVTDLAALPKPIGRTPTHYPIPHYDVAQTLRHGIMERLAGWDIDPADVESDYVISGERAERMFALFTFKSPDGDVQSCIAGKNAHDMRFPMTCGGGKNHEVCTNLDLFPAVVGKRKHTKNILTQYKGIIEMALDKVSGTWRAQEERYQKWQESPLNQTQVDHLLMESMRNNVLPTSKLSAAYDQFRTPEYKEYGSGSAWTAHSAVTHVLRGSNPHTMEAKTTALGRVIDNILEPVESTESPELLWDFAQ